MSKDNAVKQKLTREERKKRAVRIMAMVLAVLMIAGAATYTIMILASAVSAEEAVTTIDTSSLEDSGDVRIGVGLMFGDDITVGFQTTTERGYVVGAQELTDEKWFTPLWELDETSVAVTTDANLAKTNMTYLITNGTPTVGGYHVEIHCDAYSRAEFEQLVGQTTGLVASLGLSTVIPSYINSGYALRIGVFPDYTSAEAYRPLVQNLFPNQTVTVASPTTTAVSVIDPYTDRILFEFDCGGDVELGLEAKEDENGNTYLTTPAGNIYDGVFAFKRYNSGQTDGVSVINVISLESYIAGVLPYETSNSWPMETQKAFAITVRSYCLTQIGKHSESGFDLCNTTHCQVYRGAGAINESVLQAVSGTKGKVMTYYGDIVCAYYSSSMGGVTVSAKDAWGGVGDYPYLAAVETPWEKYMIHNNGFWITEISPSALLDRLHQAGYTSLSGSIQNVFIQQLATNSTYVKVLGVTDTTGYTEYITNTDTVRTSLTPYVKSANFVVGRGSVEYTEAVVVSDESSQTADQTNLSHSNPSSSYGDNENYSDLLSYDKDFGYIGISDYTVMTDAGIRVGKREERMEGESSVSNVNVMTGNGEVNYLRRDAFVITPENAGAYLGEDYRAASLEEYHRQESERIESTTAVVEEKSTTDVLYKVAFAEDSNNFIFVGKGWGHGVGMSQYGARDLAELGYTADQILNAYFTDIAVVNYFDTNDFR